jgi:5-(carboxyamino)imidazole ribonucleotide synthase
MKVSKKDARPRMPIVGILGDGQLAMMMVQAYQGLGGKVFVMGSSDNGPASHVADKVFVGDLNNQQSIGRFFEAVDVVTLENEFNDGRALSDLAQKYSTPIFPDPGKFTLIEDKLSEKQFFQSLGIDLAEYIEVKNETDIPDVMGYLKLAKGGYDGIGTYRVENHQEAILMYDKLKPLGTVLFEHGIDFKKELSLIAVSDANQIVFYPMVETHQEQGTCRLVTYPCALDPKIEEKACEQVVRIMNKLDTKGLFAFEFFLTKEDKLILNESAPRPHNSGHITLDLANCSQFENHMRAIGGLDLVEPQLIKESMTMVNLLATKDGEFNSEKLLENIKDPESNVTLYRKAQSRVKRKMGHVNLWGLNQEQRAKRIITDVDI